MLWRRPWRYPKSAGMKAPSQTAAPNPPPLSEAAKRALAEAAERRAVAEKQKAAESPKEAGGRGGLDPTRYNDWEVKGRAIDF